MLDVLPTLRPQVHREDIERHIAAIPELLETAGLDALRDEANWLHKHRFYLDQAQCDQANDLVARFYEEANRALIAHIAYEPFVTHPHMNDSYFH